MGSFAGEPFFIFAYEIRCGNEARSQDRGLTCCRSLLFPLPYPATINQQLSIMSYVKPKPTRVAILLATLLLCAEGCRTDELYGILEDDASSSAVSLVDPELSWSASSYTATINSENSYPSLTNSYGVDVTFASSETGVATIAQDGTITLVSSGTTTITASSEENTSYEASSASYTLTVSKSEAGLSWSEGTCTATLGQDNTFPTLTNKYNLPVTYSSSDEGVAVISSEGAVTLAGAGTATILASAEATDVYEGASVSYTLTVAKASATLSWSSETCSAVLGSPDNTFPTLSNPNSLTVAYSSSNTSVATIDESGAVTLVALGTTTITATGEATEEYDPVSAFYVLTVGDGTVTKTDPGLAWSSTSCTVTIGSSSNTYPTLTNPHSLAIAYASSNEQVATVSSSGEVTLVGGGSVTITATSQETDTYCGGEAAYTLTVNKAGAGLSYSASSCTASMAGANTFPTLSNPNSLSVTFASGNTSVATVSSEGEVTVVSAGTTVITASSASTSVYEAGSASYTLTVTKVASSLAWSEDAYTATTEGSNTFPTLTNPYDLPVNYSSSNTSVATISSDGAVTPLSQGKSTISATFEGSDIYEASTVSYTLTVSSGDDGAGTFTYGSTGDPSSNDDIVNTTFTRKITVTFSTSGSATVTGDANGFVTVSGNDVTVNNTGDECIVYELVGTTADGFFKLYSSKKQALLLNGVSITNKGGAAINVQSGKRTFVMIEGTNKLSDGSSYSDTPSDEDEKAAFFSEGQLILSGSGSLTVTATGKAAITSDDYVRVMDSPTLSVTSSAGHGIRGKESVQVDAGTITAKVTAAMKKGISSDSLVVFNGGVTTVTVTGGTAYDSEDGEYSGSAGVKADELFIMNDGTLTITNSGNGGKGISVGVDDASETPTANFNGGTVSIKVTGSESNDVSAKGIKVGNKFLRSGYSSNSSSAKAYNYTGTLNFAGSKVVVNASKDEAIECKGVINMTAGDVYAYSSADDAINSSSTFTISGGKIAGISTGNDGIDANGNMSISGGIVMAASTSGAECGIDVNSEDQFKLTLSGGVLFVQGGLERGSTLNQACYSTSTVSTGKWYGLTVGSTSYAFKAAVTTGTPLVVSASSTPTLKVGVSTSGGTSSLDGNCIVGCTISGGSSVSLSSYSGGNSGGGGPGGGGGGPH